MQTIQLDNMNYEDEEFTEFSEFEIKANSKKRDKRRDTKIMKKQQRLNQESDFSDNYRASNY